MNLPLEWLGQEELPGTILQHTPARPNTTTTILLQRSDWLLSGSVGGRHGLTPCWSL